MTRRQHVPLDSEHPDYPRWGSPDWAPMQEPTRLTLELNAKRRTAPQPVQLELFP